MKYLSRANVYMIMYVNNLFPSEITKQLGIAPTDTGLKGKKQETGAILKESFWKYALDETNTLEELDKSLSILEDKFKGKVDTIKNLINEHGADVRIFITIKTKKKEDNGVTLTAEFIHFINKLGASIEVDIYS